MEQFLDLRVIEALRVSLWHWTQTNVLVLGNLAQTLAVLLALVVARAGAPRVRALAELGMTRVKAGPRWQRAVATVSQLATPIMWLVLLWLVILGARGTLLPHHIVTIVASLLSAWVLIRLASHLIANAAVARAFSVTAWTIAALSTLNLLGPVLAGLQHVGFGFGGVNVNLLSLIKGAALLVLLLWLAGSGANMLERRLELAPSLSPSIRVLMNKLGRALLFTFAVMVALKGIGIDLTGLAVFSGALGVGIGFGLQKIVANLVSGVILLLDKSVKPGDVIAIGNTYGWINSLGARYASVVTRDGIEFLIPNEELITQRVENWSHSHNQVRLKVPVGISYHADVRLAMKLCLEAANAVPRVLENPRPVCLLIGFGDSSVNLEIRFWIDDPPNGRANVMSDVLLGVWDRFHEHHIEIPFPQRDLHLRSGFPLPGTDAAPG